MRKIKPIKGDLSKSTAPYLSSPLHVAILKDLKDYIQSSKAKYNKREKELISLYKIKNQPKVSIEVVVDENGQFIYVGVGDGAKGRASVASNTNGISESVEEIITVLLNHVKRNTFEKVTISKADLKALLEDEREELFDEELKEYEELLSLVENTEDLATVFKTDEEGKIILEDGFPIKKV